MAKATSDSIDQILSQWQSERPGLDLEMLGVVGRVRLAAVRFERRFEGLSRKVGLTSGLADVLAALRRAGPPYRLTPTALFNTMLVTSGGMTHRLDRLEELGLIKRLRHPDDRRALHVELTARGRKMIDGLMSDYSALMGTLKAALPDEDREKLAGLLRALLARIE